MYIINGDNAKVTPIEGGTLEDGQYRLIKITSSRGSFVTYGPNPDYEPPEPEPVKNIPKKILDTGRKAVDKVLGLVGKVKAR